MQVVLLCFICRRCFYITRCLISETLVQIFKTHSLITGKLIEVPKYVYLLSLFNPQVLFLCITLEMFSMSAILL